MMSEVPDLPIEIWDMILQYDPSISHLSYLRVCNGWRRIVMPIWSKNSLHKVPAKWVLEMIRLGYVRLVKYLYREKSHLITNNLRVLIAAAVFYEPEFPKLRKLHRWLRKPNVSHGLARKFYHEEQLAMIARKKISFQEYKYTPPATLRGDLVVCTIIADDVSAYTSVCRHYPESFAVYITVIWDSAKILKHMSKSRLGLLILYTLYYGTIKQLRRIDMTNHTIESSYHAYYSELVDSNKDIRIKQWLVKHNLYINNYTKRYFSSPGLGDIYLPSYLR